MSIPSVSVLNEEGKRMTVHVVEVGASNRQITVRWPKPSQSGYFAGTEERTIPYEAVIDLNIEAAYALNMHDKPVWSAGYMPGVKMKAYREERA